MKKRLSIIFIIYSFAFACTNKPYQAETDEFDKYLETNFQKKIANANCIYVLLPGNQCPVCSISFMKNISNRKDLCIISSINILKKLYKNVWLDSNDNLTRLKLINYSNKYIITQNGRIISIGNYTDTTNIDNLYREYFR